MEGLAPNAGGSHDFFKYQGAGVFSGETAETPYAWFAWVGTCFKPGGSEAAGRISSTTTFGKLTPDLEKTVRIIKVGG